MFLQLTSWSANYANLFNNRLTDEGPAWLLLASQAKDPVVGFQVNKFAA
jgi:hypothetical protein